MNVWNFTFGSHLSSKQFSKIIGGDPIQTIPATLPDHRLTFAKVLQYPPDCADIAAGGGPRLVPDESSDIYGVAYQITEAQFKIVDDYEQAWGYQPFEVTVQTKDGPLNAIAHNLTYHGDFAPPADSFLALMVEGLREHGYGEDIVEQVQRAAISD